jgi:hypothetical protein
MYTAEFKLKFHSTAFYVLFFTVMHYIYLNKSATLINKKYSLLLLPDFFFEELGS